MGDGVAEFLPWWSSAAHCADGALLVDAADPRTAMLAPRPIYSAKLLGARGRRPPEMWLDDDGRSVFSQTDAALKIWTDWRLPEGDNERRACADASRAYARYLAEQRLVSGAHTRVLAFPQCGTGLRELEVLGELCAREGGLPRLEAVAFMDRGVELFPVERLRAAREELGLPPGCRVVLLRSYAHLAAFLADAARAFAPADAPADAPAVHAAPAPTPTPSPVAVAGVHARAFGPLDGFDFDEYYAYLDACGGLAAAGALHADYVNFRHLTHAVDFCAQTEGVVCLNDVRAYEVLREPWAAQRARTETDVLERNERVRRAIDARRAE